MRRSPPLERGRGAAGSAPQPPAPGPAFLLPSAGRGAPAAGGAPRAQSSGENRSSPAATGNRRPPAAAATRLPPRAPRLASPRGAVAAGKAARLEGGTPDAHSLPAAVAEEGEGEDEVSPLTPPTGPSRRRCPRRAPVMFI